MLFSDRPAQSLDLNPIENVWRMIKYNIAKRLVARTVAELEEQVQLEWDAISQETIQTLIESMPCRIAEVIHNHGGHTHY